MKTLIFAALTTLMTLIAPSAFAGKDCSEYARVYVQDLGQVGQVRRVAINRGYQIFHVRTNLHGGDAAYEVVTNSSCKFVSRKLLWAE